MNENEANIQSNQTCFDAEEHDNAYDHSPRHDRDLNPSDGENGLINTGEHDDSGGGSQVNAQLSQNHSEGLGVEIEIEKPGQVDSPSSPIPANPPSKATKGFGLKKWRRIRREITKDVDVATNPDSVKILKRGSPNLHVKQPSDGDGDGDGDGSVASTNAFVGNLFAAGTTTVFAAGAGAGAGPGPGPGPDSDNSDDRSSKSSTAASAPKYRHDSLRSVGNHRDKHRVKNVARNLTTVGIGHRSQAAKVPDSSKKHRGQSPFSSVESDLRSCNSVFPDQAQSGRSINFDGEDAYDEPASQEQSAEQAAPADCSNNGSLSQDNATSVNSKNYQLPGDCDPLVSSIQMLQSAQVALEREVQRFGEMGKGIRFLCDDSYKRDCLSDGWASEFNHLDLNKNIRTLETRLSETEGRLKDKEMKIVELEGTIKNMESSQNDTENTSELQHKRCQDMEAELDSLLKQKIEAEVEYLLITTSTKDFSVLVEDQIKLLREQKALARERAPSLKRLIGVENKDALLRGKVEQLDTIHQVMEGGEKILKMQRTVVNSAKCFFIQLILLVLVLVLFVFRLMPKSTVVVPT